MGLAPEVRAWVSSLWDPVIMVQASPEVDAMCQECNGTTFVELLRPFGVIPELNGTAGGAGAMWDVMPCIAGWRTAAGGMWDVGIAVMRR